MPTHSTIEIPCGSRRAFLRHSANGFGLLAFSALAAEAAEQAATAGPLAAKPPHFPARAKHVIFLCMQGGPSHVDTFDYKPALIGSEGRGTRGPNSRVMPSPWTFKQNGKSGLWISEVLPELSKTLDYFPVQLL